MIPLGWILLYSIFDEYRDLYRKSRIRTLARTFWLTFVGVLFLFFTLILDDSVRDYRGYIESFFVLFLLQFILTALSRSILLTAASSRLKAGLVQYPTLIIGGNERAVEMYEKVSSLRKSLGYNFVGFIYPNGSTLLWDFLMRRERATMS